MVIVKLGGSLAAAGTLRSWLDVLSREGAGRSVVVPGGAAFADAVRTVQRRLDFSDRAAHRMALLAMEQYAELLTELMPELRPCGGEPEIQATLAEGGIALWLPYRMATADPSIAESWAVTSDSLAAWLAGRLAAKRLVLVKSVPAPKPMPSAAELAALDLVDPAFPAYAERAALALIYCGPGEEGRLAQALRLG